MGEPYKYNSSWKTEDLFKNYLTISSANNTFIKLDFSNLPATPIIDGFANNGDTLELWWNGSKVQSWKIVSTTASPVYVETGSPMGLLMALTYQL